MGKSKCYVCNKKISEIEKIYCKCKCGEDFCQKHRTTGKDNIKSHICTYDYMSDHKNIMEKENPIISFDKLNII
jgi:hypothetical protein